MIDQKQLHALANECHFSSVGSLKARVFNELQTVLNKRFKEQRNTAFEEPQIPLRVNPFMIMVEAKSILVTATSYHTKDQASRETKPAFAGELARFSRGMDYHQVVHKQLASLANRLAVVVPDLKWKAYVDTGPLVDRYLAAQAGMGVYGKNNCFIIPGVGSYVVIGYLVINKEVINSVTDPQPLAACHGCGTCQKACPTKALETPYQIDPRRCLSHLLQQKETIPQELRPAMAARLYGCDVCQDVCPYNQEIPITTEPNMVAVERQRWLDLSKLLSLSNRAFNRQYRNSAFGWRGQKILQRNAIMALGNARDPGAVELIRPFLFHPRNELSEMAQWAMNQHHKHKTP